MNLTFGEGVHLVAGGSGGIGAAIVRELTAAGCEVAFTWHRGEATACSVAGETGARAYPAGGEGEADARALADRVRTEQGEIGALVVATGIGQQAAFHALDEPEWRRILDVDLALPVALARATLVPMMKRGRGRVVFLGSIAGGRGIPGLTVYSAAKAGLEGLCRSLAREAGAFGVTVNCVAPGFVDTPMLDGMTVSAREEWTRRTPLGRLGRVEDIVPAVLFLLSDQGGWVTGETLHVDGGLAL